MRLGYEQTWLSGLAELDQLQLQLNSECSDLSVHTSCTLTSHTYTCSAQGVMQICIPNRAGQYDTTIIDTTDTDTSSCSIDTWFLAIPIRYLAHVMYFGVYLVPIPGISVPSEIPRLVK